VQVVQRELRHAHIKQDILGGLPQELAEHVSLCLRDSVHLRSATVEVQPTSPPTYNQVLQYLDPETLSRIRLVCRAWDKAIVSYETFWFRRCVANVHSRSLTHSHHSLSPTHTRTHASARCREFMDVAQFNRLPVTAKPQELPLHSRQRSVMEEGRGGAPCVPLASLAITAPEALQNGKPWFPRFLAIMARNAAVARFDDHESEDLRGLGGSIVTAFDSSDKWIVGGSMNCKVWSWVCAVQAAPSLLRPG
jgi:hypothetical protein